MKSCGVIVTYIDWKKVKKWFFNIPLFLHQLTLIVMGTVYRKFKWEKAPLSLRVFCAIGIGTALVAIVTAIIAGAWFLLPVNTISFVVLVATYRGIDWRRVWRAAQASHVRLCLRKEYWSFTYPKVSRRAWWLYINFGYPTAKIDSWRIEQCKGKRFRYYDPTFNPSPEFVAAMIEYAEAQVGKGYDDLQLISNGLHLIAWIVWPWCWGKELKVIKAFNRKGGREHCISGVTACLRWHQYADVVRLWEKYFNKTDCPLLQNSRFFEGYSTATTSPCLIELSKNWRERETLS